MKVKFDEVLLSEEAEAFWEGFVASFFDGLRLARLAKNTQEIVKEAEVNGAALILRYRWLGRGDKMVEAEMEVLAEHWEWRTTRN